MATSSASSTAASVRVLGLLNAAAIPMTSEATTIKAAAAVLRMLKPIHSTVVDGLEPLSCYQAITGMLHSCNLRAGSDV